MVGLAYAAGEGAGLPQFEVEHFSSQIFWAFVSFVVLLLLFQRFVLPRFQQLLDKRSEAIRNELEQAAEQRRQAEIFAAEYRARLEQAEAEVRAMIRQSQEDVRHQHKQAMAELKAEITSKKTAFLKDIEFLKQQALKDIRDAAADIAITAAEKLIARQVSAEDASHMVDEAIHDLESKARRH